MVRRIARSIVRRTRRAVETPAAERRRRFAAARALADGDEPELRLLRPFIPGAAVHDVGANVGLYTYWAVGLGARRVVAYEPNPVTVRTLRRGVGATAEVRAVALSDRAGTATMTVPHIEGRERRTRGTLRDDAGGGTTVDVATTTLDDCDVERDAVLKVDVEGHELALLGGARRTLAEQRPLVVLIELSRRQAGDEVTTCIDLLVAAGYDGWGVRGDDLIPVAAFDPAVHQSEADQATVAAGGARPRAYVTNFVFVRGTDRDRFLAAVADEGFSLSAV